MALHVQGFGGNLIRLNGIYFFRAQDPGSTDWKNHGKPVYVKEVADGSSASTVYFWDDRDGNNMSGWWVAPSVSSDMVWAFNPSPSVSKYIPPRTGWRVPWHHPEADTSIVMQFESRSGNSLTQPDSRSAPARSKDPRFDHLRRVPVQCGSDIPHIRTRLQDAEHVVHLASRAVDTTKDLAVIYTCEVADHLDTKDAIAGEKAVVQAIGTARAAILQGARLLDAERKQLLKLASLSPSDEELRALTTRADAGLKELTNYKDDIVAIIRGKDAVMAKARKQVLMEIQKKMEMAEMKRRNDVVQMNLFTVETIASYMIYADHLISNCPRLLEEYDRLEGTLQGMMGKINCMLGDAAIHAKIRSSGELLRQKLARKIERVSAQALTLRSIETDFLEALAIRVAAAIRAAGKTEDRFTLFKKATRGEETLSLERFMEFISSLKIQDCASDLHTLFNRAVTEFAGKELTAGLTQAEFFFHLGSVVYVVGKGMCLTDATHKDAHDSRYGETWAADMELTPGAPLLVLDGPVQSKDGESASVYVESLVQNTKGWLTVRKGGKLLAQRFSQFFEIAQETVLTDKFDLVQFKVLRRITPGERFVALDLPHVCGGLMRIHGYLPSQVPPSRVGYVTFLITKNHVFLKNHSIDLSTPAAVIPWDNDVHSKAISQIIQTYVDEQKRLLETAHQHYAKCVTLTNQLLTIKVYEEVVSDADIQEMIVLTDEASTQAQWSLTKLKIPVMQWHEDKGMIRGSANGPLVEFRPLIQCWKEVNSLQEKLSIEENRKNLQKYEVLEDINSRNSARALGEIIKIQKKFETDIQQRRNALHEAMNAFKSVVNKRKTLPNLARTDLERCRVEKNLKAASETAEDTIAWCVEQHDKARQRLRALKMPASGLGLQELMMELNLLYQNSYVLQKVCKTLDTRTESLRRDTFCRGLVEIRAVLRKHLETKKITVQELFATLCDGGRYLSPERVLEFTRPLGLKVSDDFFKRIFQYIKTPHGVTEERFFYLLNAYMQVSRPCSLIAKEGAGKEARIRELHISETLEGLSTHYDGAGTLRVKVRCHDKAVGYVLLRGNRGSEFLKPLCGSLIVLQNTAVTEESDIKIRIPLNVRPLTRKGNYSLVRTLKKGEIVSAESLPVFDPTSRNWRIKGTTIDGAVGWVTLINIKGEKHLDDYIIPLSEVATFSPQIKVKTELEDGGHVSQNKTAAQDKNEDISSEATERDAEKEKEASDEEEANGEDMKENEANDE